MEGFSVKRVRRREKEREGEEGRAAMGGEEERGREKYIERGSKKRNTFYRLTDQKINKINSYIPKKYIYTITVKNKMNTRNKFKNPPTTNNFLKNQ